MEINITIKAKNTFVFCKLKKKRLKHFIIFKTP